MEDWTAMQIVLDTKFCHPITLEQIYPVTLEQVYPYSRLVYPVTLELVYPVIGPVSRCLKEGYRVLEICESF